MLVSAAEDHTLHLWSSSSEQQPATIQPMATVQLSLTIDNIMVAMNNAMVTGVRCQDEGKSRLAVWKIVT